MLNLKTYFRIWNLKNYIEFGFFYFYFFFSSIYMFQTNRRRKNKKKVITSNKTYEKVPPNLHLRLISFQWRATYIMLRFGRSGKMDFMKYWKVGPVWYNKKKHFFSYFIEIILTDPPPKLITGGFTKQGGHEDYVFHWQGNGNA